MTRTVHVPISALSSAIRDSLRAMLVMHGYELFHASGRRLSATEVEAFLHEAGNNLGQAVVCLDESESP